MMKNKWKRSLHGIPAIILSFLLAQTAFAAEELPDLPPETEPLACVQEMAEDLSDDANSFDEEVASLEEAEQPEERDVSVEIVETGTSEAAEESVIEAADAGKPAVDDGEAEELQDTGETEVQPAEELSREAEEAETEPAADVAEEITSEESPQTEDAALSLQDEPAEEPAILSDGFHLINDQWCWYQNGKFQSNWNGIVKGTIGSRTAWYYVKNGVYDPSAQGLTKRADGTGRWYYVENGVFKNATGIAKRTDGSSYKWFYVKNGAFLNTNGLVKRADQSSDQLFYIQGGVWTKNSGISQMADGSSSQWLYVANGVHTKDSGLTKRADGSSPQWFYVQNGVFKNATGIAKRADGSSPRWYYVENGTFKNANGITKRADGSSSHWFYVQNGAFTNTSGAAPKADNSSKDLYYVEQGVYTRKTCLAEKADGSNYNLYYMNNGIFDASFNGTLNYFTVANGIVNRYPGMDISWWNGTLDFPTIKAEGYDFIIPRVGWGMDEMDPSFEPYVKQALAAGVQVPGVYHFIYAISPTEAIKNAKAAIQYVEQAGLPKSTVIWCDLEYDTVDNAASRGVKLKESHQKKYVEAFCDYVLSKGYPTGVYVNQDYMSRVFGTDFGSKYDLWLADYEGEAAYPCVYRQIGIGELKESSAPFDLNVYYGQYTAGTAKIR